VIAKANGVDDALAAETGMCFLIAMMRAGLVDARGDEVKLLLEKDRPGADPGVDEEDRPRLQRLRSDLKALGLRAVPEEPTV
jgi:hypothetical protein